MIVDICWRHAARRVSTVHTERNCGTLAPKMYFVFWMYLGVCLLLATRGTPRLYGSHTKALLGVANQKMYFVETGRAPCRKGKTLERMQIVQKHD